MPVIKLPISVMTVSGTGADGSKCKLPFTYKDVTYFACTFVDYHSPWCSLTASYSGKWGICVGEFIL